MQRGRPTKYRPEMCETVLASGLMGKTLAGMAHDLEIDRETLGEWAKIHPEFSSAIKTALLTSQAWWEDQGRVATFGGIDGFNATSYIFQMKNRFRADWNDTLKNELSGPDGGAIPVEIKRTIVDPSA